MEADTWDTAMAHLPNPVGIGNRLEFIVTDMAGERQFAASRIVQPGDSKLMLVMLPPKCGVTVTEYHAETGEQLQRTRVTVYREV